LALVFDPDKRVDTIMARRADRVPRRSSPFPDLTDAIPELEKHRRLHSRLHTEAKRTKVKTPEPRWVSGASE
jgi:hypothetical protein